MRIKAIVRAVLCAAAIFVTERGGLAADQTSGVASKPATSHKGADPFLNGPPFKFDQVLRLLRQSAIPLRRRKEAIQHRGLAFSLSPAGLDKLKAAGASEDMLDVIKSKAKPETASVSTSLAPVPPPPAPPPA